MTDALTISVRMKIFADENFKDNHLSGGSLNTCMRISRRGDKTSSCNHDMDLVIGGIALMFIDPYWFGG